ncbi:L-threonylcarbamoyladenylate synthase [Parvibium lacunae]|uniref:Threonylcarbamoyl-AMP synthase n=1 Tax=Parvibium lacunae TaxID=1888893 RepID=A0A368L430_9BURK|nr:L-threonylcarbamoyladenylate synthase [Parvibium lacunae]RCS58329.1 threonylcarbamoyl-AMP synthase [Parvibium lacunae]
MSQPRSLPLVDDATIAQAAQCLQAGGLVALPTETVYGLGANAADPAAVAKIFAAKGRPADHPLIVHIPSTDYLTQWAQAIPAYAQQLAAHYWPGPLTLILPKQDWVPLAVTGGQTTVGLRCPNHPVALRLLQAFAKYNPQAGIAAPSANTFGRISPTLAAHVAHDLGNKVDLILDGGPCEIGIESTIIDCTQAQPQLLRRGAITAAAISALTGLPCTEPSQMTQRVSGNLAAHYAPRKPLYVLPITDIQTHPQRAQAAVWSITQVPEASHWEAAPVAAEAYAHDLYAVLHRFDETACTCLLFEAPPQTSEWAAVWDRLQRAQTGSGKS